MTRARLREKASNSDGGLRIAWILHSLRCVQNDSLGRLVLRPKYNRRMLKNVALVELFLCWIVCSLAFVKPRRQASGQKEVARAAVSKWGIGLVMLSFALTWAYVHPVGFEKSEVSLIVSMILGPPSVALVWAATR